MMKLMKAKVTLMLKLTNDIMVLLSLKMSFYGCIIHMLNMVGYVRFTKNICTMQVLQEVLFQFALVSIWNIQHMSKQHEKSGRHQRLRKKLYKSENELKETLQRAELSLVEKVKVNISCITKCIHTIYYLIRKILQSTHIMQIWSDFLLQSCSSLSLSNIWMHVQKML